MSHPVYGVGTSALVYIGDEVSDRADGVPIGHVDMIGTYEVHIVGLVEPDQWWFRADDLCLVKRAEP